MVSITPCFSFSFYFSFPFQFSSFVWRDLYPSWSYDVLRARVYRDISILITYYNLCSEPNHAYLPTHSSNCASLVPGLSDLGRPSSSSWGAARVCDSSDPTCC